MRILVVSDLHYTLRQLDWVVAAADEYDLVILAGDLLSVASIVEPAAQIAVMLEYLSRLAGKTAVVACSGNHDLDGRNELDELYASWLSEAAGAGVLVDGARLEHADVLVTVCPWWDGPRTRDAVDRQLIADAAVVGTRQWYWVYHAPPDDSPTSWTGKRFYGDPDLRGWIDRHQPNVVLTGHVHQAPFASDRGWLDRIGSTWIANAGRQIGPVPTHVVIDTNTAQATWVSQKGVETASLVVA